MPTPSEIIRDRRKALNLTLEDIARRVGVTRATVSKWEHGDIANMRRDKIQALATILEVDPTALIGDEEPAIKPLTPAQRELWDTIATYSDEEARQAFEILAIMRRNRKE